MHLQFACHIFLRSWAIRSSLQIWVQMHTLEGKEPSPNPFSNQFNIFFENSINLIHGCVFCPHLQYSTPRHYQSTNTKNIYACHVKGTWEPNPIFSFSRAYIFKLGKGSTCSAGRNLPTFLCTYDADLGLVFGELPPAAACVVIWALACALSALPWKGPFSTLGSDNPKCSWQLPSYEFMSVWMSALV